MKKLSKKQKEMIIIFPLAGIVAFMMIGFLLTDPLSPANIEFKTQCQEGWFKYELDSGTLCSKNKLTEEQIESINFGA